MVVSHKTILKTIFCCLTATAFAQGDHSCVWKTIAPYFVVPQEYVGKSRAYDSVLSFADGTLVRTAADWECRRSEIVAEWGRKLGEWPPLVTDLAWETLDSARRENFTQYWIRFRWTPDEKTEGYLLVPDTPGSKPAVITVFYEPESAIGRGKPDRDFAYQLARRGFVTLSLGTTQASENKTYALFYPDIDHATVAPLSMLGYAAANAWQALARLPEVDSTRIGIMGHSFGGKWAMFASCLYGKFACAVWSDPGIVFDESRPSVNYWEPYYLGYHPRPWRKRGIISAENPVCGTYVELRDEGRDLHELHALMAPRPFMVSGGSEDPPERWIPLNSTIAVNRLLGFENRVAMTNRPGHAPTSESNELIYMFFDYFMK